MTTVDIESTFSLSVALGLVFNSVVSQRGQTKRYSGVETDNAN